MKNLIPTVFLAAALFVPGVHADDSHHKSDAGATQAAQSLSEGVVRKVDKDAKKITIKHGPLVSLDMPAMTMVFQVRDPAMLEQVKAGDSVRFEAQKVGGAFTITAIEPAK